MGCIARGLPWSALVFSVSLVSGATAQSTATTDSAAITAEVRAFLRDRADGNVEALVDHIWPAKIKPSSREDRGVSLALLSARVRAQLSARPVPANCGIHAADLEVAVEGQWAVAGVVSWQEAYAAAGESCVSSVALIPLQRVAGRWKVSGTMPEQREE